MEKKLFGLSMSKGKRISLYVALSLSVLFLAFYVVTGFFMPEEVIEVLLPSGNLSASIFEAQNMTYTEVEGLGEVYELPHIPFSVDVPEATRAMVGTAMVASKEPYCFYYNVVHPDVKLSDALSEGLTTIVRIDALPDNTVVEVLSVQEGFINGCNASFYTVKLSVEGVNPRYVGVYRLRIDESVYVTDKDILIACMSEGYSTENLLNLQKLAQASVGTLRYSLENAKKLGIEN